MIKLCWLISLTSFLFLTCARNERPILAHVAHAKSSHGQVVTTESYELPSGIFRGVLWPDVENHNFQIWIIANGREEFFNIPAPAGFDYSLREVTKEWEFKACDISKDRIVYLANKKDTEKSIELDLPLKNRNYSFFVLANSLGKELVIFADISENITDQGLFGYAVIG